MRIFIFFLFLIFLNINSSFAQLSRNWVTYYGSSGTKITATQYDPVSNCIYICGITSDSTGISTPGSFKPNFSYNADPTLNKDIFIAKFDTSGNRLWATYYGGESGDYCPYLFIDNTGNVYISGSTHSTSGIATSGTYLTVNATGGLKHFVAKFNPNGQRIWGTYYGNNQLGLGVMYLNAPKLHVDNNYNVYIVGATSSTENIATPGTYQPVMNLAVEPLSNAYLGDAYLAKFNSSGQRIWGTYFGGGDTEIGTDLYVDHIGNIYITGWVSGGTGGNNSIASPNAQQSTIIPHISNGFLAKFSNSGQRIWGTYIGGNAEMIITNLSGDLQGNVYLYGITKSDSNIATIGTHQLQMQGLNDAFLMKYNTSGQKVWGTYYGGSSYEEPIYSEINNVVSSTKMSIIITQEQGDIYICGKTNSPDGIKTDCAYKTLGFNKGFIAKFANNGTLKMGSYYDASVSDISLGPKSTIFFGAFTNIDNLATPGTFMSTKPTGLNASLIARFKETYICPDTTITLTASNDTLTTDTGYVSYSWYKNGTLVHTGTSNQYVFTDSGQYHVVGINNCQCRYFSDTLTARHNGTGINDLEKQMALRLYPNPSSENIVLSGFASKNQTLQIILFDIIGKEMEAQTLKTGLGNFQHKIKTAQLPSGMYFMRISSEGKRSVLKFVKK